MNVLLVVPSRREAMALLGNKLVCGTGSAAGEAVATRLAREPADIVAIAGVCGGLDPALSAGDLVLATGVAAVGRPDLTPDAAVVEAVQQPLRAAGRRFASARLLTVDRPVGSAEEKRELWNASGAAGVDMETYTIAEAVVARGLPWFALRAVVDPAGAALPRPLRAWRGEEDGSALVFTLLQRPQYWPALARLALQMRRATGALTRSVPLALRAVASPHAGPVPQGERIGG